MRIRVERHSDFTVTHHVLKHLGIHPGASLVAAECMTADMGSHLRYLLLVDRVELGDDALEVVLPMQGDQGHPVLVQVQESAQAVDFGLDLRSEPLGDDFAEALGDLIGHRDKPDALLGLRLLDHVAHLARPLQLPLDPDALRVEVDVGNRQAAELGYPQPGLEQDEDALVVTRIMPVALDELKEPALLFPRQRLPRYRIVHHDRGQLEIEGVLSHPVVLKRHPKSRAKDAANRMDTAVAAAIHGLKTHEPRLGLRKRHLVDTHRPKRIFAQDVEHRFVAGARAVPHAGSQGRVRFRKAENREVVSVGNDLVKHIELDLLLLGPKGWTPLLALGGEVLVGERPTVDSASFAIEVGVPVHVPTVSALALSGPQDAILAVSSFGHVSLLSL